MYDKLGLSMKDTLAVVNDNDEVGRHRVKGMGEVSDLKSVRCR